MPSSNRPRREGQATSARDLLGPWAPALVLALACSCASVTRPASLPDRTSSLPPAATVAAADESRVVLSAEATTTYNSNPFHYSDADLDELEQNQGPGQRFHGIESEWDMIAEASLEAKRRFVIEGDEGVTVGLGGHYSWFLQNSIASFGKLDGVVAYDFTARDRIKLDVEHTPDRFKKNYKLAAGGFGKATYDQNEYAFEYERALTEEWSAGAGFEYFDRDYNPEFEPRDRVGRGYFLFSDYRLQGGVRVGAEVFLGEVDTGVEDRGGLLIDRSYDTLLITPEVRVDVGNWDLRLRLQYREREYTTQVPADDGRFDRVDERLGVRIDARTPFPWYDGTLKLRAGWEENDSDLVDPTVPPDETGYEELILSVGLEFSF